MIPRINITSESINEVEHSSSYTPYIPEEVYEKLPRLLKEPCEKFSDHRERDLFLTSALGTISGCLPGYHFVHDLKKYYANLFVFISAPAASGKSRMNYAKLLVYAIDEKLKQENRAKKESHQMALSDYYSLSADEKAKQMKPDEPDLNYLFIPANSSSAAMTDLLKKNEGRGIIFESEADTLSNTFEKDWANYSDNLRKSYEHEDILQNRKGIDNYVYIQNPRISIVLSGTPMQLVNLIKSHENGLFSRFIYYTYTKKPKWKKVFSNTQYVDISEYFKRVSFEYLRIYEYCESKEIQFQWNQHSLELGVHLDNLFSRWTNNYTELLGEDISSTIFRLGVTITRISAILSLLRDWQESHFESTVYGSKEIMNISLQICEVYLNHAFSVYGNLPENKILNHQKSIFFSKLPEDFKRNDIQPILQEFSITERTLSRYLKEFTEKKLLENYSHGCYRKIQSDRFR